MIENNYYLDNTDLVEQVENCMEWEKIIQAREGGFVDAKRYAETKDERFSAAPSNSEEARDYYRAILESAGEITGKFLAPRVAEMNRIGLKYRDGRVEFPESYIESFKVFKEAGLIPYGISREFGGLGLPESVHSILLEIFARADVSFSLAVGCVNIGEVLERFASHEIQERWLPELASVNYTCAMALTEPDYGSDLAGIVTRAERDDDGNWKLSGTKRFITHACGFHDIPAIILTLARTGSPTSGARGLSLFIVESKDVKIGGIEKKLGLHCSPTCEVIYEKSPGILVGKEGEGLIKGAMGMMNTSRLSIAAQTLGISVAACEESKKYASERIQFGRPIKEIPAVAEMLDGMEREIFAMRSLLHEAAFSVDIYLWDKDRMRAQGVPEKELRKNEDLRQKEKLADLLTPISKYHLSEVANRIAYDAVQIHGGSGYVEDYDVARIYRDARIGSIYEGTSQMQVTAAIGNIVVGMGENGFLRRFINERISEFSLPEELKKLLILFGDTVELYKKIESSDIKERNSFHVADACSRFLCSLFMASAAEKLSEEGALKRKEQLRLYMENAHALIQGDKIRLEYAARF